MTNGLHLCRPDSRRLSGHWLRHWSVGFLGMVALSLTLQGCAISRSHLTETTPEGVKRDLQLNNYATLFTTQSIEKQRASIGKTLSAGNIMLDQQANGTNFVEALKAIRDILQLIR